MFSFNALFGFHEKALSVSSQRAELLASNIVNADTPHYLAKDLDFKALLKDQMSSESHSDLSEVDSQSYLKYRVPNQISADGNTVDINAEKAAFANNSMRWMASYTFINQTIQEMHSVLKS